MREWFHGHRRFAALGLTLVLVAGAAVAVIIATARVDNNSVETPVIGAPPPPPPTLAVALEPDPTFCAFSSGYEAISSSALFTGQGLDYSDPMGLPVAQSSVDPPGLYLCVKNQSVDTSLEVSMSLLNVFSEEVDCDVDEDAVDGTCTGPGDIGELDGGALTFAIEQADGDGGCGSLLGVPLDQGVLLPSVAFLDAGEYCAFDVYLFDTLAYISGFDPDPVYSSDVVFFDIVFDGDDASAALVNWYPDNDGDSFGDESFPPISAFDPPPGYANNNGDCNDGDPTINPAAAEIPGDLIDNDCDGLIDEP